MAIRAPDGANKTWVNAIAKENTYFQYPRKGEWYSTSSIPSLRYGDSVEVFRIYALHSTTSLLLKYCEIKLMESCARWRTWRWVWGGWSWRWRASPQCTWEARRGPARRWPGRQRRSGRSRKSCKRSQVFVMHYISQVDFKVEDESFMRGFPKVSSYLEVGIYRKKLKISQNFSLFRLLTVMFYNSWSGSGGTFKRTSLTFPQDISFQYKKNSHQLPP